MTTHDQVCVQVFWFMPQVLTFCLYKAARSTLTSSLVALFVESLLFGVFAVLYAICTWLLVFRDARGARGRCLRDIVLFVASTLMFVLTLIVSYPSAEVNGELTGL